MTNLDIRLIQPQDDQYICQIIQQVGGEFGAVGDGFGPGDAEVANMSAHYLAYTRSAYYVALVDGKVVGGGGGIAPFAENICELRKLFLLAEYRGRGIGKALTQQCLADATAFGYQACYLDTLATMESAIRLYAQFGFEHLEAPLPVSEHGGCDVWMLKQLEPSS